MSSVSNIVRLDNVYNKGVYLFGVISTEDQRLKLLKGYTNSQIALEDCCPTLSNKTEFPFVNAHCVYKVMGQDSNILYIGKSSNGGLSSRLRTHLNRQETFEDYDEVSIEVSCFYNEADCLMYEVFLIGLYDPPLNLDKPEFPSTINLQLPKFEFF